MLLGFEFLGHVVRETPCVLQAAVHDNEDLRHASHRGYVLEEPLDDVGHRHCRCDLYLDTTSEDLNEIYSILSLT